MLTLRSILCSGTGPRVLAAVAVCAVLAGCGQKGPLFLPDDAAAADRATLPDILMRRGPPTSPAPEPSPTAGERREGGTGTGTAAPVRTP